jgi:hypothetical protein
MAPQSQAQPMTVGGTTVHRNAEVKLIINGFPYNAGVWHLPQTPSEENLLQCHMYSKLSLQKENSAPP